jgi:enamine deaminase RidA (YjgF/YER057c/UK114 family)
MMVGLVAKRVAMVMGLAGLAFPPTVAVARDYIPLPPEIAGRSYSPGVVTRGGKIVWLAGVTTLADEQGKSLAGDIGGQTRYIFRQISRELESVGGKLDDIVTMTVFLTDARNGAEFSKIRHEVFPVNPPASSQITISALAVPGFLIEIQCVAVLGDEK